MSIIDRYTTNVYRDLQGFYGEIRVQGFQIYGGLRVTIHSHFLDKMQPHENIGPILSAAAN